MSRTVSIMIALCFTCLTTIVHAEDLASEIVKYFPGKWQYKAADGTVQGSVDWKVVAGGKCVGGPGESNLGAGFALAGWDPERKIWVHVWHREDGQYGRLEITMMEGDTYYGEERIVEGNGKVVCLKIENKIISQDHFMMTERAGDEILVTHWHRVKK